MTGLFRGIMDGGRRETRFFIGLAVLLVLVRAATFALVEGIVFNSDEALYGLMAKHLSEFRAFPLFSYGENYQLAVESWLTAPFFWLFGPSVLVMKLVLVLLNLTVTVTLMQLVARELKLRPALAFLAVLPFIMPTPVVAGSLMENSGSATDPLLYVAFLWALRRRPFAFGALLMFGFLHREFTIYAVPALVLVKGLDRGMWTRATAKWAAWAASGSALVWLFIDLVRRSLEGFSAVEQAEMLVNHVCWVPAELSARVGHVFTVVLPTLVGSVGLRLHDFSMRNAAVTGGFALVGWAVAGAMVLMLARLAWTLRRAERWPGFGLFLALVGCFALAAYPLSCNLVFGLPPVVRYVHLALFLPIGCFAAFMACERSKYLRTAVVGVFLLWGSVNLVDNLGVMRTAYVNPEPDPHRELTDYLVSHQIRYARAGFWDAYIVDFLSGERVIVDSIYPFRIPEYRRLVEQHATEAVNIVRMPCQGQLYVANAWCIQYPGRAPVPAGPPK
jgi:hypothetical protein